MNETRYPEESETREVPLSITIFEYWAALVRRKWIVLGFLVAGVAVAAVLCVVLPKSYRSSTLILIENQKIPDDYVKGIGGANIEERLTMIQQQVMSRTLLGQILDEFKLYEGKVKREGIESAIAIFRKTVKVETSGTSSARGKSVEAVTISFAHEDPVMALKVTAKLASLFIEENLKVREQLVTGVTVFFEQELQDVKKSLELKEQAISEYKTKYVGRLPEQIESNLRTLDRFQMELNQTNDLLHSRADKLSLVERLIKEYEASEATRVESDYPQPVRKKDIDPLVVRLRELEHRLTALRAEWKETYPDIVDLRHEIAGLQEQLVAKYGPSLQDQDSEAPRAELTRSEPRMDLYIKELYAQRNELRNDLSSLNNRRERLLGNIKDTERRVEQTPAREQELMILVRDYENMQKNYHALLDKRLNANVAVNLEKRQKGEQFRILDPANLPEKPDSPNRLLIMAVGLFGGCGLGVGLAFGLERLNPTFRRREEVELLPGIHVLASIPQFFTAHFQNGAKRQRDVRTFDAGESSWRFTGQSGGRGMPRAISGNGTELNPPNLNLVAKWQPRSIAAEQYRMAATKLVLSTEQRQSTVIEVTSALMGEGKTTTAVNLGYTIARDLGKKTLLIDCDFQRPALQDYAPVPARWGLIELLDGRVPLEDCLSVIDECPCAIMAMGGMGVEHNELTRIQQLKAILPELRAQFQYLIINTPPVLSSATMGILASLADELVVVIRAGTSPKHLVQQAFMVLGVTAERQVILNGVDPKSMSQRHYGYALPYEKDRSIQRTIS